MRSAASGMLTCPGVCCGYVVFRRLSGLDSGVWRAGDKNGNGSERGTLPEVRRRVSPPRSPQPIKIACALVSSLTTRYVYRLSTTYLTYCPNPTRTLSIPLPFFTSPYIFIYELRGRPETCAPAALHALPSASSIGSPPPPRVAFQVPGCLIA